MVKENPDLGKQLIKH